MTLKLSYGKIILLKIELIKRSILMQDAMNFELFMRSILKTYPLISSYLQRN